jgi:surface antigen
MIKRILLVASAAAGILAMPVNARIAVNTDDSTVTGGGAANLPPYLQCVPYARQLTGIQIRGDAWTWWDQAEGRYARGFVPKVGAVMALKPHANSRLGHVAAVSKIIDSRTILIRHSNWSPINGRRGQIEDNVRAVDVSPDNDWSAVRVWYGPSQALGTTHWPLAGFIYASKPKKGEALPDRKTPRSSKNDDPIAAIIKRELGL